MKARPRRIVIVGRPNVGKSTLFNRLTGRRSAIVHDEPGVTRDWTSSPVDLDGRAAELVDTGGIDLADEERLVAEGRRVALEQLGRADLLLFLVDGASGPTAGDFEVADLLRPLGRPVVLAVNKCDTKAAVAALPEFHAFGFGDPVGVSAQHGTGTDDLRDALRERLPEGGGDARPSDDTPRVAVVGRPNVGKSSLVNRLLGEERMIVSEVPGTTRDSVDSTVRVRGKEFLLVDTAGIRKRTRTSGSPDELAVILAKKSLERCDVAVLVLDASAGPTSKDAAIAGLVVEARRPAVILANKWDLKGKEGDAEALKKEIRRRLPMLDFAEVVFVSAHSGRRTGEIWSAVERARAAASHRVTTGELNRWIADVVARGPSFVVGGTIAKLRYAAQVGIRPPTIALFTSRPGPIAPPVARYLENRLRESFPAFSGAPVVIRTTGGRRPSKS